MTISEKVAYLKGLAEGLDLDTTKSKEGKLISVMIGILEELAMSVEDLEENALNLGEEIDVLSDDLADVESEVFDEDDDLEDYDDDWFEVECPTCGADIVEMNTVRKRLSAVKGGRFAENCRPAKVYSVILSDILGDPLDMIASGPAYPDSSTCAQALTIASKYSLELSEKTIGLLNRETPKSLSNVETVETGSVKNLCRAAAAAELCQNPGL